MTQDTQHIPLHEFLYEGQAAEASQAHPVQDPFLALSGAFESFEPSDVAGHKHEYLAKAHSERHTS